MFEAKDILPLLGIPGTKIKSFDTILLRIVTL